MERMDSSTIELELRAIRKLLAKQTLIMALGAMEHGSEENENQYESIAKDVWEIDRETDRLIGPVS